MKTVFHYFRNTLTAKKIDDAYLLQSVFNFIQKSDMIFGIYFYTNVFRVLFLSEKFQNLMVVKFAEDQVKIVPLSWIKTKGKGFQFLRQGGDYELMTSEQINKLKDDDFELLRWKEKFGPFSGKQSWMFFYLFQLEDNSLHIPRNAEFQCLKKFEMICARI